MASRRGNHEVMMRGTFAKRDFKKLSWHAGTEGGVTYSTHPRR